MLVPDIMRIVLSGSQHPDFVNAAIQLSKSTLLRYLLYWEKLPKDITSQIRKVTAQYGEKYRGLGVHNSIFTTQREESHKYLMDNIVCRLTISQCFDELIAYCHTKSDENHTRLASYFMFFKNVNLDDSSLTAMQIKLAYQFYKDKNNIEDYVYIHHECMDAYRDLSDHAFYRQNTYSCLTGMCERLLDGVSAVLSSEQHTRSNGAEDAYNAYEAYAAHLFHDYTHIRKFASMFISAFYFSLPPLSSVKWNVRKLRLWTLRVDGNDVKEVTPEIITRWCNFKYNESYVSNILDELKVLTGLYDVQEELNHYVEKQDPSGDNVKSYRSSQAMYSRLPLRSVVINYIRDLLGFDVIIHQATLCIEQASGIVDEPQPDPLSDESLKERLIKSLSSRSENEVRRIMFMLIPPTADLPEGFDMTQQCRIAKYVDGSDPEQLMTDIQEYINSHVDELWLSMADKMMLDPALMMVIIYASLGSGCIQDPVDNIRHSLLMHLSEITEAIIFDRFSPIPMKLENLRISANNRRQKRLQLSHVKIHKWAKDMNVSDIIYVHDILFHHSHLAQMHRIQDESILRIMTESESYKTMDIPKLMYCAIITGKEEVAKKIYPALTDHDYIDHHGKSLLMNSLQNNLKDISMMLIRSGVNLLHSHHIQRIENGVRYDRNHMLYYAAGSGIVDAVTQVWQAIEHIDMTQHFEIVSEAMAHAVSKSHIGIVKMMSERLESYRFDPIVMYLHPIINAAKHENEEILQYLLSLVGDEHKSQLASQVYAILASEGMHSEMRRLLNHGVPIVWDSEDNFPLLCAIRSSQCNIDTIKLLIDQKLDPFEYNSEVGIFAKIKDYGIGIPGKGCSSIVAKDIFQFLIYHSAIWRDKLMSADVCHYMLESKSGIASLMIENGLCVNAVTSFGVPIVIDAINFNDISVFKQLIDRGVDKATLCPLGHSILTKILLCYPFMRQKFLDLAVVYLDVDINAAVFESPEWQKGSNPSAMPLSGLLYSCYTNSDISNLEQIIIKVIQMKDDNDMQKQVYTCDKALEYVLKIRRSKIYKLFMAKRKLYSTQDICISHKLLGIAARVNFKLPLRELLSYAPRFDDETSMMVEHDSLVRHGNTDCVMMLLDHGYMPPVKSPIVAQAIHLNKFELAKELLNRGADPNNSFDKDCVLSPSSALQCAVATHQYDIVRLLIEKGADPMIKADVYDEELCSLCGVRKIEVYYSTLINSLIEDGGRAFQMYIEHGIKCIPGHVDCFDIVDHLLSQGKYAAARLFLQAGVPFNLTDDNGRNFLHITMMYDRQGANEWIRWLLERGFDINCTDKNGDTALHIAAMYNSYDVALCLLNLSINVNTINNLGNTALHTAAHKKVSMQMVKLLIDAGIDIYSENSEGNTFKTIILQMRHTKRIKLIIDLLDSVKSSSTSHDVHSDAHAGVKRPSLFQSLEYQASQTAVNKPSNRAKPMKRSRVFK